MGRNKIIENKELLEKVRGIVVRDGINVSSHKIAKEIGISNAVLFQRFGSKENLLFAAMSPPAPDLDLLLGRDSCGDSDGVFLERITWGLFEYFRSLVPILVPLAITPSFRFEEFRKRYPDSPLEKLTVGLMKVLEDACQKKEIDCPDVGSVVLNLLSSTCGLALFERMGVHNGNFNRDTIRNLSIHVFRSIAPKKRKKNFKF